MKNFNLIIIFVLLNNFIYLNLQSKINNTIVVKVGKLVITSIDLENAIITSLIINNKEVTQVNIDNNKNYSMKNLVNKAMKQSEIKKYQVENYNQDDLQNYIKKTAENLQTNQNGLIKIFKQSNINYETFVEMHKIELLWNTLIYQLYKNQANINIVDVDNEVEKIKENMSEEEIKKIKQKIFNKKKEEKFVLFSRSHLSNLENTIIIEFQ